MTNSNRTYDPIMQLMMRGQSRELLGLTVRVYLGVISIPNCLNEIGTHNKLFHHINDCIPINVTLEKGALSSYGTS